MIVCDDKEDRGVTAMMMEQDCGKMSDDGASSSLSIRTNNLTSEAKSTWKRTTSVIATAKKAERDESTGAVRSAGIEEGKRSNHFNPLEDARRRHFGCTLFLSFTIVTSR